MLVANLCTSLLFLQAAKMLSTADLKAPGRSQGGREHVSKVFHTGPEQCCPEVELESLVGFDC